MNPPPITHDSPLPYRRRLCLNKGGFDLPVPPPGPRTADVIGFRRKMQPNGRVSYPWFTPTVRDILGFHPQDMAVNAAGCLHVIHWADRDDHLRTLHRSAVTLTPCAEEFRAISADGKVRWLKGASHPRRQANGETLWRGVLVDITDARKTEMRQEVLLNHASEALALLTATGEIVMVNAMARSLFGYRETDMVGRHISTLLPGYALPDEISSGITDQAPLPHPPSRDTGKTERWHEFSVGIRRSLGPPGWRYLGGSDPPRHQP